LTRTGTPISVTPHRQDGFMEFATTVDYAQVARLLSRATRRLSLTAPGFRCPPRLVGVDRTIRRRETGCVVSVRVKGRPQAAVLADMIEGIVVSNALVAPEADRLRSELWSVVDASVSAALSGGVVRGAA
jgi:hypothetical protein